MLGKVLTSMLGKVLFLSSTDSSRNFLCTRSRLPMSSSFSSWSCSHCTFLNPPSQKLSCQMCLSASVTVGSGEASSLSFGVAASPGRWPCSACTYLNRHGSAFCEVCGTRAAPFSRLLADDLHPDDLAATGSVFLPLQRSGSKRPIAVESSRNVGPVEKLSRSEKHQHMDLSRVWRKTHFLSAVEIFTKVCILLRFTLASLQIASSGQLLLLARWKGRPRKLEGGTVIGMLSVNNIRYKCWRNPLRQSVTLRGSSMVYASVQAEHQAGTKRLP
ncbi:hypothetical protein KSP39_PZI020617 [Platanthera zijinensis]|uniref:RanBP2-type domain-containing protein n=1 Tax=Platanthera zijinensis TaxID=2320716 RepID=A0AAP0B012_9ASPA